MSNLTSVTLTNGIPTAGSGTVSTLDALLATLALESGGNLAAILAAILAATGPTAAGTPATASRVVQALASTGTQSNVAGSASDGTILASNASRLGFSVFNDSTATLYLLLASGTSSTTVHTVQVGPGAFLENSTYAGIVKGLWSSATGSARVTEYS